jgi:hypothetical protein
MTGTRDRAVKLVREAHRWSLFAREGDRGGGVVVQFWPNWARSGHTGPHCCFTLRLSSWRAAVAAVQAYLGGAGCQSWKWTKVAVSRRVGGGRWLRVLGSAGASSHDCMAARSTVAGSSTPLQQTCGVGATGSI